jgi:hypothetical protein
MDNTLDNSQMVQAMNYLNWCHCCLRKDDFIKKCEAYLVNAGTEPMAATLVVKFFWERIKVRGIIGGYHDCCMRTELYAKAFAHALNPAEKSFEKE